MSVIDIHVQEPYYSSIELRKKNVEGRLAKDRFKNLKEGDGILINNTLRREVERITIYPSFREMLIMEGVINTIPDAKTLDEAEAVYYKFYSALDEKEFSVCAIKFK